MSNIKVVKGNAVDAALSGECNFMLHVVNCQGVMGSGVAKEVKQRIPSAYTNYLEEVNSVGKGNSNLGSLTYSKGYDCFNLHAQEYYGYDGKRYISYKALIKSLFLLSDHDIMWQNHFEECNLKIAIPYKMGSDRAGGDWGTVCEILEAFLGHHEINAYKL